MSFFASNDDAQHFKNQLIEYFSLKKEVDIVKGDFLIESCYNSAMKTLIETNPYLKDAATRKKLIERSVTTSCGVEGIKVTSTRHIKISHDISQKVYLEMLNKRLSK